MKDTTQFMYSLSSLRNDRWIMDNILERCTLCPRRCGADRLNGKYGFCGAGSEVRIAGASLHMWEEPCISGKEGSGTVFFSNCTLKCVFCQNYDVSTNSLGYNVSVDELSQAFLDLQGKKANNINLVTPTHYVPQIIEAIETAREKGLVIPIVYNTSGYENVETIKMLDGYIDIYMPDLKYYDNKFAAKFSGAADYSDVAMAAVDAMYRQVGKPVFDSRGMMKRGVLIRHLMLPGLLRDSIHIIDYISKTYGNNVYFSLMSQYTPLRHIEGSEALNHKLDFKYYNFAVDRCIENGLENVYVQNEEAASESFIPQFYGNKM